MNNNVYLKNIMYYINFNITYKKKYFNFDNIK